MNYDRFLPVASREEPSSTDPPNQSAERCGAQEVPEPQVSIHLCVLFLVDKDPVDPENSVPVQEPCLLRWAPLLNHPDQVAIRVLLNAQEEAIVLPFLFGQFTLSGVEGGGHFCDEKQMGKSTDKEIRLERETYVFACPVLFCCARCSNAGAPGNLCAEHAHDFQTHSPTMAFHLCFGPMCSTEYFPQEL